MMRAPASGNRLDEEDAAIVKGMISRGDRQHDIAAWFGVNGGRIAEVASGATFAEVNAIHENLPPAGPYTAVRAVHKAHSELQNIRGKLADLLNEVDEQITRLMS